jgi:hypothetical protein
LDLPWASNTVLSAASRAEVVKVLGEGLGASERDVEDEVVVDRGENNGETVETVVPLFSCCPLEAAEMSERAVDCELGIDTCGNSA